MDTFTIKTRLLQMVANSDSRLQPQTQHVSGNWHVQTWQINAPYATVRMTMKNIPIYGFKPPTVAHGELYSYGFSVFIWGQTMSEARDIMDNILDYLYINNKQQHDVGIVDIINLKTRESVPKTGPRRYWRMILSGEIITEETIDG